MRQFRVSNLRTNAFGKLNLSLCPPPKKNIPTILPLHVETNNQKYIIAPGKKGKNILCSIQTSLTKQLKVKVHPEKQSGWCQGRRSWVRDQGGTGLERTQLGPRWASETLGHLLPKRCLQGGNPLQKPQEIREKNSMQSKTSLFIEIILLHWQSWRAVMQKQALGEKSFFSWLNTPKRNRTQERTNASRQERKDQTQPFYWTEQNRTHTKFAYMQSLMVIFVSRQTETFMKRLHCAVCWWQKKEKQSKTGIGDIRLGHGVEWETSGPGSRLSNYSTLKD